MDDLPRHTLETAEVLRQNSALLKSIPMYTCLETISREEKSPRQRKPRPLDIVQVDVGIGQSGEIYSWPGEEAFSSLELGKLIGQGFLATGIFYAFAHDLFVEGNAVVRFVGDEVLGSRDAIHFTYRVPSLQGGWKINWHRIRGDLDELGDFWVDRKDMTLLRLRISANEFPPGVLLSVLTIAIDYEMLSIGKESALIPSRAEIVEVEMNGTAHRDSITFSQCHVFEANSRMSDSPATLATEVDRYEARREALPARLTLPMTLETEIRAESAKVGDPLTAHLDKRIKVNAGTTAPEGAQVRGRIRVIQQLYERRDMWEIGLEFNELEWAGHVAIFLGEPVNNQQIAGFSSSISHNSTRTRDTMAALMTTSTREDVWPPDMAGVATFFLAAPRVIPKGFRMTWRTKDVTTIPDLRAHRPSGN